MCNEDNIVLFFNKYNSTHHTMLDGITETEVNTQPKEPVDEIASERIPTNQHSECIVIFGRVTCKWMPNWQVFKSNKNNKLDSNFHLKMSERFIIISQQVFVFIFCFAFYYYFFFSKQET